MLDKSLRHIFWGFKWIEWNLEKIAAHALSAEEVEAAYNRVFQLEPRPDGSYRMLADLPSSLPIRKIPMPMPQPDTRSESRKSLNEELAAASMLPIPAPSPGDVPQPLEAHLHPRRPIAVVGIVENGVVRLLDEGVTFPEHSRVIVVASHGD